MHRLTVENFLIMKKTLLTTILLTLAVPASQAAWQRLGGVEKRPIDTASASLPGVRIAASSGLAQPENLISDEVTPSSKAGAGASHVVINLGRQLVTDITSFVNEGAEGSVTVSSSADQRTWATLAKSVFTGADSSVLLKYAGAQAKYVRLEFNLAKGGNIKQLGIYGTDSDQDFKVKEAAQGEPSQSLNVASGLGGSRIIYIHPSPAGGDELAASYGRFEFPESDEKYRTVVYDLGQARTLTEVGSVHSPRPVRFQAFAFEKELPEKEDWRGRRSFDFDVFNSLSPIATVEDAQGLGHIKAKLAKSVRARYIALRWEPDFNPPAFGVSSMSITASGLSVPTFSPGSGGGGGAAGQGQGQGQGEGGEGQGQGQGQGNQGNVANGGIMSSPFSSGGFGGLGLPTGSRNNGTGNGPNATNNNGAGQGAAPDASP